MCEPNALLRSVQQTNVFLGYRFMCRRGALVFNNIKKKKKSIRPVYPSIPIYNTHKHGLDCH